MKNSAIVTKARNVLDPDNIKAVMAKTYEDVIKAPASKTWSWMKDHVFNVKVLDGFQTGLDVVGVFPGFGEIADGINGLIYTARGDELNAALSYSAMIPIVGNASTAGKWINKGAGAVDDVSDAAGKTKKTVDDDVAGKGVTNEVIRDGSHISKTGVLKPNIKYQAGEYDYHYKTDEIGRINEFNADDLKLTERDNRLPHKSNTPGKEPGDHAGHLAADRFGGSPDYDNLVSQSSDVNLSKYKKLENKWAKAIEEGKQVSVNVKVNYDDDSLRPISFEVKYVIDGVVKKQVLEN
ncbi:DNA/RNA non-specific endonuclease [Lysinibacillus sp. 54212]|uniref:DNA/RNA non-specific endonuclease n=1 Tax=Lysinibacillus sp. 54212 TaxID=3119829 RepID=UPI002FCC0678